MTQLLAHLAGDYVVQSTWMAINKNKRSWPCFIHCLLYSACFLPLQPSLKAWLFIFGTHFLIDRFGLARYVVYAKEQLAPWHIPWKHCTKTGYLDDAVPDWPSALRPPWISVWLTIVADNTLHLILNYCALTFL